MLRKDVLPSPWAPTSRKPSATKETTAPMPLPLERAISGDSDWAGARPIDLGLVERRAPRKPSRKLPPRRPHAVAALDNTVVSHHGQTPDSGGGCGERLAAQLTPIGSGGEKSRAEEVKLVLKSDELLRYLEEGERSIKCTFVGSAQIQMDDVYSVAKSLRGRGCKLQHFELKNVQLGADAIRVLAAGLRENLSLKYLGLERTRLNNLAAQAIADVLKATGNHIAHLDLSRNVIGDDGAGAIASALCSNRCLRHLNLSSCGIGTAGGQEFAKALRANQTLELLDLASNSLKEVGCMIAHSLPYSSVRSIDVSYNNMPPEAQLAIEAAVTLPPEIWHCPSMDAALRMTRSWVEQIPLDIWKSLRIGETMKTYLEAVEQMWQEHAKEKGAEHVWDLLASLYAPLTVCHDNSGSYFEPERLQRLAHMCVPRNRACLLQVPLGRTPVHDLLVLNLSPFDLTFQTPTEKVSLKSWSSASVSELSKPKTWIASSCRGRPVPSPRRPSHGRDFLKLQLDLQTHVDTDHSWLPDVVETVSIDQGVGESRYRLRSIFAGNDFRTECPTGIAAGNAGELRCLYSVKDCADKRTGLGGQASMATLIWSPPAALRAVPLRDLQSYWQRQKTSHRQNRSPLSATANMYDAVTHAIRPSTAAAQCSLSELLDFGPAETFVSHWWGSKLESTLEALEHHCNGNLDIRVWICSVANNQRRISEELGGNIDQSSFSQALHSKPCRAMAFMLDDGCETLKRIWCLYEVLCVILMRDKHEHARGGTGDTGDVSDELPIEFDLCTPEGILNHGNLHSQAMEIGERISTIDVAHAQCSAAEDKVLIDAAIKQHLGGYTEMNMRIRDAVDQTLVKTQTVFQTRIQEVRTGLRSFADSARAPGRFQHMHEVVQEITSHGALTEGERELLAQERERNKDLAEENARLHAEVKKMKIELRGHNLLRQENAALKDRLRKSIDSKKSQWN